MNLQEKVETVQTYFRQGGTIDGFLELCGVKAKTDGELLILDYDMLKAKWDMPQPWVCRGLILDAKTYDVVAFGLPKFWNAGETAAATIDWSSASVFEKLDGTMVQRFWHPYRQTWAYSTRYQLPDDLTRNKTPGNAFRSWQALFDNSVGKIADSIDQQPHETTIWEVMSPDNIVVVQHQHDKAALICIRDNRTFQETPVKHHPLAPKCFPLASIDDVNNWVATLNGLVNEGVVVCDAHFQRVKVKSDDYVAKHRALDGALRSISALIELIHAQDWEEFVVYFPHTKDRFVAAAGAIDNFLNVLQGIYDTVKHIEDRKEYALALKAVGHPSVNHLFQVRDRKTSVRDYAFALKPPEFVRMVESVVKKVFANSGPVEWVDE